MPWCLMEMAEKAGFVCLVFFFGGGVHFQADVAICSFCGRGNQSRDLPKQRPRSFACHLDPFLSVQPHAFFLYSKLVNEGQ